MPDANRANYDTTRLGSTSTVGCFPEGVSPYKIEGMSGNVWEWTRSLDSDYPYSGKGTGWTQRARLRTERDAARVLRGGAFWDAPLHVRCADQSGSPARYVLHYIGFRIVVAGLP